jgi:hypothetical protein
LDFWRQNLLFIAKGRRLQGRRLLWKRLTGLGFSMKARVLIALATAITVIISTPLKD